MDLYNALIKLRPQWEAETLKVVMTGSTEDGPEWQKHIGKRSNVGISRTDSSTPRPPSRPNPLFGSEADDETGVWERQADAKVLIKPVVVLTRAEETRTGNQDEQ